MRAFTEGEIDAKHRWNVRSAVSRLHVRQRS